MARARFGRLPRQAPSLTATIVALAQEYQRVRESNIVDAWKNGGEFEGKPVHDKDVMAWMKSRRDELTPGDPKWDYYDNQITQYEFAIANSKQELAYKRGDVSDTQMAQFYHKWAGKLPKNSEAYREREKLAAAYVDRAQSGAAGRARSGRDARYSRILKSSYDKEFTYDATLSFLTNEAMNRGILQKGEDISNIDPNTADGREINRLWDEIANSDEYKDERDFYTKQIKENGNPGFKGDFSQDAFNGYGRTKKAAVNDRIRAAKVDGRQGDITAFTKEKDAVRYTKVLTGGFDETEQYEEARKEWLAVFSNPHSLPTAVDRANQKYVTELNNIKAGLEAGLKTGEVDYRLGAVNLELRTMAGDEAPVQHWAGMFGPGGNEGGKDATETAIGIKENLDRIAKLQERDANGQPLYVLTKKVDGNPVRTTSASHGVIPWGVVARAELDPNAVFVVQNDFGDPRAGSIVTAVSPTPIYIASTVRDEQDGAETVKQGDTPAAYNYVLPDGKTGYKYQDSGGNWLYTPDNPFGSTDPVTGVVTPNPPTITSEQGTVNVPGSSTLVAGADMALLPSYYNTDANKAMSARLGKSGYSLWLIASDPKDTQAYTLKNDDIVRTLELEAGGDMNRLREMVIDADEQRAVYLGTSTEEQMRIRRAAAFGVPMPVPLASVRQKLGIEGPGAEQKAIDALVAAGKGQFAGKEEDDRLVRASSPDTWARKVNMVASPPPITAIKPQAQTALGLDIPAALQKTLGDIFAGITGNTAAQMVTSPQYGPSALPGQPRPSMPTAPGVLTGTGAPKPTPPPKPTAPTPPKPLTGKEKDDIYTPPKAASVKPPKQEAYDPRTGGHKVL